jgi:hypothetical protein
MAICPRFVPRNDTTLHENNIKLSTYYNTLARRKLLLAFLFSFSITPHVRYRTSFSPHVRACTFCTTLANMYTLALAALVGTALAYPGEVLRVRELTERDNGPDGCPHYLPAGQYEKPAYITQISKSQPDKAFGPNYNGIFTPNDISSIFSFDIPAERADANCTLEFLFPKSNDYSYSGGGSFAFTGFNPGSCPGPWTTYNDPPAPGPFPAFPPIHMEPGNLYTIDVGPCFVAAGTCAAGMTGTNDTNFNFFQNDGGCPIGK